MALYHTYETLEDAMAATDLTALIPARFTHSEMDSEKKKYVLREIRAGDGREDTCNEAMEQENKGQSSTQVPMTHVLKCQAGKLRIIDPPGIGDTRGTDFDRKNFNAILECVANVKELHAIWIVMKPNEAKLDVAHPSAQGRGEEHLLRVHQRQQAAG